MVNDLVTLTVINMLKIDFLNFVAAGRIVFHKHILFCFFFKLNNKFLWSVAILLVEFSGRLEAHLKRNWK